MSITGPAAILKVTLWFLAQELKNSGQDELENKKAPGIISGSFEKDDRDDLILFQFVNLFLQFFDFLVLLVNDLLLFFYSFDHNGDKAVIVNRFHAVR